MQTKRTTTRGIENKSYISVARKGRRRDFGQVIAEPQAHDELIYTIQYRSSKTGNIHTVGIASVRLDRDMEKRRKAVAAQTTRVAAESVPAASTAVIVADVSKAAQRRREQRTAKPTATGVTVADISKAAQRRREQRKTKRSTPKPGPSKPSASKRAKTKPASRPKKAVRAPEPIPLLGILPDVPAAARTKRSPGPKKSSKATAPTHTGTAKPSTGKRRKAA